MDVLDSLSAALQPIAWTIAGATIVFGFLGLLWKMIERKILSIIEQKAIDRKQKKIESLTQKDKIRIERTEPTYEEWKAAQEKIKHSED